MICAFIISSCQSQPVLLYPGDSYSEVIKLCRIALRWGKSSFVIQDGRVKILDSVQQPSVFAPDHLSDGTYYCGAAKVNEYDCNYRSPDEIIMEFCKK